MKEMSDVKVLSCGNCAHATVRRKVSENEMPFESGYFVGKCDLTGKLIFLRQKACKNYKIGVNLDG